jgi:hypothetical protein
MDQRSASNQEQNKSAMNQTGDGHAPYLTSHHPQLGFRQRISGLDLN